MKVKVINRSEEQFTRARSQDVRKVHKNLDPSLHPMEQAHEYVRAVNAAKLDRVFAKPFIAALPHDDGVTSLAKNPKRLNSILSGSADGQVRLWDVANRRCLRILKGHSAAVRGIAVTQDGHSVVSCSDDSTARLWKVPAAAFDPGPVVEEVPAVMEFQGKGAFRSIDHHWQKDSFVTAGSAVEVWDHARSEPLRTIQWGADSVTAVRFNPAEPDLLASCGADRSVALYDLRTGTAVRKLIMQTRSNALAWNPVEAFNFTVANEDCCLYSYDMRKLSSAKCVHKDFVSAVMDVDFSPTGREFVAGGYDRSVRIFPYNAGHSREVYHTRRMQRVFAVRFSMDGAYVFTGSDDMNLRIWKAEASEQLGTLLPREKHRHAYNKSLIEKHKHLPEVKRVVRHRHLPAGIYKTARTRREMEEAERRRTARVVAHSAPGSVKFKATRKKKIVQELE
ncbi:unnamed protein product [Pedinophyceae sp. YPF-701]|nr:unnamed protein product [Pedinophyceae sp. YPF-701]